MAKITTSDKVEPLFTRYAKQLVWESFGDGFSPWFCSGGRFEIITNHGDVVVTGKFDSLESFTSLVKKMGEMYRGQNDYSI